MARSIDDNLIQHEFTLEFYTGSVINYNNTVHLSKL